jgi:protocatechuate 4,5-dioxygenase alpha chain
MTQSNWRQTMPSAEAYWMNRVLYDIHHIHSDLQRYKADPDAYMAEVPLAAPMKAAIRDNDIGAMYLAGVNPLLLRAHCLGLRISEAAFVASLRAVGQDPSKEASHG